MKLRHLLLLALMLGMPGRGADSISANATKEPGDMALAGQPGEVHFEAVDVIVDSGDIPLGAYQFELTARAGDVMLAGLEGGEPAAFRSAPFYDPAALQQKRIIVAAFSTADTLPAGKSRVARLMVQVTGQVEPVYATTLTVAASGEGKPIHADLLVSVHSTAPANIPAATPRSKPTTSSEGAAR